MEKNFLTGLTVILLSMGLILAGCEGPTGADGAPGGGGGTPGDTVLSGKVSEAAARYALASGKPVVFAGAAVYGDGVGSALSAPLVIDRAVTLVANSPALDVNGTVVIGANASFSRPAGTSGQIKATVLVATQAVLDEYADPTAGSVPASTGGDIVVGTDTAVMGDVTISDDPTSATNINSSASTTNLYVIGNVTVSDAVTSITNFVVTGGITATAGITATEVTVGGTLSSSVTGAAALTVGTINGNVVLSGLAPQIGVNTAINGNLGVTTALSNLTLNDAVTLAVSGSLNAVGLTLGSGTTTALVVGGTADIGTLTGGSDANQITFNGTTTIGTFANTTASTILQGTGAVTIAEALGSPNLALIIKSEGGVKLSGTRTIAANVTATDAIFKGNATNGGVTIDADEASGVVLAAAAGVGVGKIVLGSGASLVVGTASSAGTIDLDAFTADSMWNAFDVSGGGTVTVNTAGIISQTANYGIGTGRELVLTTAKVVYTSAGISLQANSGTGSVTVGHASGLNLSKNLTVANGVTLDLTGTGKDVEFYDADLTLTVAAGGTLKVPNSGSMWGKFRTNATKNDGATNIEAANRAKVRIYGRLLQNDALKGGINKGASAPITTVVADASDFQFVNSGEGSGGNYIEYTTSNDFGVLTALPVGGVVEIYGAVSTGLGTGYHTVGENVLPLFNDYTVKGTLTIGTPAGIVDGKKLTVANGGAVNVTAGTGEFSLLKGSAIETAGSGVVNIGAVATLSGVGTFTHTQSETTNNANTDTLTFKATSAAEGAITGTVDNNVGSVLTLGGASPALNILATGDNGVALSDAVIDVSSAGKITVGANGILKLVAVSTAGKSGGIFTANASYAATAVLGSVYAGSGGAANKATAALLAAANASTTTAGYIKAVSQGSFTGGIGGTGIKTADTFAAASGTTAVMVE